MKGTVHIINRENSIGKILLDDGRESLVMTFPATFEEGDRAEVEFQNNDPTGRVIRLSIPGDEWEYGFIITANAANPYGSILSTYPKLRGLLFFYKNNLRFKHSDDLRGLQVKFKIKKLSDGRMSAVDIQEVSESERYRCQTPVFGHLERRIEKTTSGIVQEIVMRQKSGGIVSGRVKFAKENNYGTLFGFIRRDDGQDDIYFKGKSFSDFYGKKPCKNDVVHFKTYTNSRGDQLRCFCEPAQNKPLSEKEQYGFIRPGEGGRQVRFRLSEYRKIYGREPEAGDIVYYHTENNQVEFSHSEGESIERIFFQGSKGAGQIARSCSPDSFKNFVEIDKQSLYFAYSANAGRVEEVYRFNSEILSEAIACYKDRNIRAGFHLEAVETLLRVNYQDKNITREKLQDQQTGILNLLITEALKKADYQKALAYECRLQRINYKPARLKKFSQLPGKIELPESAAVSVAAEPDEGAGWQIMMDTAIVCRAGNMEPEPCQLEPEAPAVASLPPQSDGNREDFLLEPDVPAVEAKTAGREPYWQVDITLPREV